MTLLELAKERFGNDWTAADETLFRKTGHGEDADYGEGDPAKADQWGADRVLRADRIVWLCTDREAAKEVTHRGVQIRGARVEGELDLSFAKLGFPLAIINSAIQDGIRMQDSHLLVFCLNGTHTGPIRADGVVVADPVFLRYGFQATGAVSLVGAKIGGDLDCENGHFNNPNGYALNAAGVEVKGFVFLRNGFQAEGEVGLIGAKIGRNLECENGHFKNPEGHALNANGVGVRGPSF